MVTKGHDFDVAVIGSGPGGYVAAIRCAQLGAKVALIEKGPLGGVCANVGCIPTKALVHSARVLLEAERAAELGLTVKDARLDFARVAAHRDGVVAKLRKGVEALLKANKVEVIRGEAVFEDEHRLSVRAEKGGVGVSAARIVVAAGSVPVEVRGMEFDGERVIDSTAAVGFETLPESLLIVGGGYIGCEFAAAFVTLGVEVTVVEMMDRLLPLMDPDCGKEVFKYLKRRGAKVFTGVKVEELKKLKGSVKASLSGGKDAAAEKALICVGRRPSVGALDLAKAGVKTDAKGAILVNEHMQTSAPHVYAIGDVHGGIMLAHVASQEGLVAAAHATGKMSAKMDYRVVPACAFTVPEVATVGMSEDEAKRTAGEIRVKRFPLQALGKAQVDGHSDGFVKMIADAKTGELLGVHMVAHEASALIGEAALALKLEATAEELAETIHAHPTMSEALREAAEGIVGLPVNWPG